MSEHETFWTLIRDPAHWQFELFLMFLADFILGLLVVPWVRYRLLHHTSDDQKNPNLARRGSRVAGDIRFATETDPFTENGFQPTRMPA